MSVNKGRQPGGKNIDSTDSNSMEVGGQGETTYICSDMQDKV